VYLKRNCRKRGSECYEYWTLLESVRTQAGPRQRVVATLSSGLGTAPRKLLEEMAEIRSLDVVLPTGAGKDIRLRSVSKPEQHLAILLQKLGMSLPNKPKSI
jgi:hypothetical protein